MSTVSKLDKRVRMERTERRAQIREFRLLQNQINPTLSVAAYAAAEALDEIRRDSKKTGKAKQRLLKRILAEYASNERSTVSDRR